MNIGDIVVLKSGGPKMTIVGSETVGEESSFLCSWFSDGVLAQGVQIPEAALLASGDKMPVGIGYMGLEAIRTELKKLNNPEVLGLYETLWEERGALHELAERVAA